MLVCVPISDADLRALAGGAGLTAAEGFGITPEFLATFGLGEEDSEDAERTLAYVAGLAALLARGRRLVAVADAAASGSGEMGEVTVERLAFAQVSALFADEDAASPLVAEARSALAGLALADAWDAPAHARLLQEADLLWYGPEEWASLV